MIHPTPLNNKREMYNFNHLIPTLGQSVKNVGSFVFFFLLTAGGGKEEPKRGGGGLFRFGPRATTEKREIYFLPAL
jgi:hypothetical protein